MIDIVELVILFLFLVVILPFFIWMHELGHLLFIVILRHKPVAILCSNGIFARAVARESIKNRKHEAIVTIAGFLGGLLATMIFSLILTFVFGFWYGCSLGLGLMIAAAGSIYDFRYLPLIRKYPVKEREKKLAEGMKKIVSRCSIAIILSRKRWIRWKKKQEEVFGVKINVREIALN